MLSSYLIPLRAIQELRPAKCLIESHSHPFYHLLYVTSGAVLVSCGNEWSRLKAGDLILICPQQIHMIYALKDSASTDVKFSFAEGFSDLKNQLQKQTFWLWREAASASSLLGTIMKEAKVGQSYSIELISGMLYLLLVLMLREKESLLPTPVELPQNHLSEDDNNTPMQNVLDYIDAHLTEELTVTDLAQHFGYSTSYFSTIFRKKMSLPPQQYILLKKVDLAKKLIRQNQKSISAISDLLHFCSVQAFTNTFRRYCGVSPKQYYRQVSQCAFINLTDSPLLPPDNVRAIEPSYGQKLDLDLVSS